MLYSSHGQLVTVRHGSADTVVRATNDFNGKRYFSGADSSETLWRILKKFGKLDYVGDPTPHSNVGANRFKGACLRMREVVAVRRLFFYMSQCASLKVRPLDRSTPLTAQTTRPVGIHIPFMVWIIKINIFPIFTQKSEKLHYGLWQLRTAITPAPLKIHSRCLHQTMEVFGVGQSNGVLQIYPWLTLVAMATNHRYLNTKLAITRRSGI